jgi:hypothetical protein
VVREIFGTEAPHSHRPLGPWLRVSRWRLSERAAGTGLGMRGGIFREHEAAAQAQVHSAGRAKSTLPCAAACAHYSVEAARRARMGARTLPPVTACADASDCGIGGVRRKRLCGKAFLHRGADGACAVLGVQALAPTACTTIEEVGSTGVGALTLGFLALAVSTATSSQKSSSGGFILQIFRD